MIIALLASIIGGFAFIGMVVLLALRLVFGLLKFAGKTTFKIAGFGLKLAVLFVIFLVTLIPLLLLGIIF